jgi:hypothetical protein
MSWSDVFPIFTDEMVEEFERRATKAERAELEMFHGVAKVFNAQNKPHIVSVSLFWKHVRESDPDLPEPTRELMMNAKQLGLVRRFSPWECYVEPLLNRVPGLRELYPDVVFRVYLALDLDFLIPDLVEAGCEVYWMKSSSIRLVPGSLWRLLPFEEQGKVITMLDGDLMEHAPKYIARTEAMADAKLGAWRQPLASDFGPEGNVRYLPFLGCHSGIQGGWPVRQLLDAFTWHCRRGLMPTAVCLPGGGHSQIEQARWPDYGFEEWFLTAAMYPRVAGSGVLTFLQPTDHSVFLLLDIEYVTWANSRSEIVHFPS